MTSQALRRKGNYIDGKRLSVSLIDGVIERGDESDPVAMAGLLER
jgi:hypothetical protein